MTTTDRQPPNHNTLNCVKHYGCLRPECIERHRAYQRERYHSRTAGTWEPLVDAEPVRRHLAKLYAADFTAVRIGELAGVPFETVVGFTRAYGYNGGRKARKRRCTPEVAAKILSIDPETAKPGVVDATGTIRRIQALVAAGWPMQHLGPRFGISQRTARALVQQERVYGRTAEAVTKVYEQLAGERPERHGVSRNSVSRARSYATKRRWPTVKYWADRMDVIDDPHFTPEYRVKVADVMAEEATFMADVACLSREEIAARLGRERWYIDRLLDGPQQDDMEEAA